MNKSLKSLAVVGAVLLTALASSAQDQNSSAYFMDSYTYRHDFNPAFASSRSYFALPAVSDINLATRSQMGLSSFVYPTDNGLSLFTSSKVSSEEFLSRLKPNNKLMLGTDLNILSVGFWGKRDGFTTVGIKLKAGAGAKIPGDLFEFAKNIGGKELYNISNLGVSLNAYLESYLGFSKNIGDNLRVGAKAKFLIGLAAADVKIDNMNIKMSSEQWAVSAQGSAKVYAPEGFVNIPNNENGNLDFGNININQNLGINDANGGFGFAVDLGATYTLFDRLTLSAAVLDLGSIGWNNCIYATTGNSQWTFNGFENISLSDDSESGLENQLNEQIKALTDSFYELIQLKEESRGKASKGLTARVNLGAEYQIKDWLSVAALYSQRFDPIFSNSEARFFCNFEPTNWLSCSGSFAFTESGTMLGAALSWNNRAFNLFIATESLVTSLTPPFVVNGQTASLPVNNLNISAHAGLVINLGKRRDR